MNQKQMSAWAKANGVSVYEYATWLQTQPKGKGWKELNTAENRASYLAQNQS